MKILLLITVCEQNKDRIFNQLANLNKHKNSLLKFNITPVFVCGDKGLTVDTSPYEVWNTNTEETYNSLYKKIFASFEISLTKEFDYIIKIDDDTLFNIDLLNKIQLDADCIGRLQNGYSENSILIYLPMYNIDTQVKMFPSFFSNIKFFFTGDFYILSRKVIEFLVNIKPVVFDKCLSQDGYVPEDQLIGYALKDQWDNFTKKDISLISKDAIDYILQITNHVVSLHPIHTDSFLSLMSISPDEQIKKLTSGKAASNFWYRKYVLSKLEKDIHQVFFSFLNSNRQMGMG